MDITRFFSWFCRILAAVFIVLSSIRPAFAQQIDVEVEIAGPWDYVSDGSDGIIIVATNTGHQVVAYTGENANAFMATTNSNMASPPPGIHTLKIDSVPCGDTVKSNGKLYSLSVSTQNVKKALGTPNARFGISLPKPCWYESYQEARSKVSPTLPLPDNDSFYTTWMVFHYRVKSLTANLVINPDIGTSSNHPVLFGSSTQFGSEHAISLVMGMSDYGGDTICDGFSAQAFDDAKKLWGITDLYRQFPMLDSTTFQQTARYSPTCSPSLASEGTHPKLELVHAIRAEIKSFRESIAKSQVANAETALAQLHKNMNVYWSGNIPTDEQKDIKSAQETIDQLRKEHVTKVIADQTLLVIGFRVSPGRTDCHTTQMNINTALP
jgi:hypothetical protein